MKERENKQLQRMLINEAVKDYLARGGVITKIDANHLVQDYNSIGQTDDFDQFVECQFTEAPDFLLAGSSSKMFDL